MTQGGARHLFFLRPEELFLVLKYNFISQPFGAMAVAFGKISVGLLILRIMGPNTFWHKWFIYVNLFIYMIITIISCVFIFTQCTPAKGLWDPSLNAKCWDPDISVDVTILQCCKSANRPSSCSRKALTANSAYGTFLDFALALLPITIIWKLNMSVPKKLAICTILGLGIL